MNTILLILAIIVDVWWLVSLIQALATGLDPHRLAKWNTVEIVSNLIVKIFGC